MAKKYISKKNAFQIISVELHSDNFMYELGVLVNKQICKKSAAALQGIKYGFCSTIYKIVNNNGDFRKHFRDIQKTKGIFNRKRKKVSIGIHNKFGYRSWRVSSLQKKSFGVQ